VTVPALGAAPIALDFAFPILEADGDDNRVFSFFVGFSRF
jgi:outer membrane protein insertion porin family